MVSRVYKNLLPDSLLHRELESLLRKTGGVATVEEIYRQVFLLPTAPLSLARDLVQQFIQDDPRLRLQDGDTVQWSEPSAVEVWQRAKRFLVVDVETTDGMRRDQRIIELGVCRIEGGRMAEEWSQLIHADRPLSPWVRQLTGLTDAALAQAPRFAEVAERLLADSEDAILVGHHARFDVAVISGEISRLLGRRLGNYYLCTVELARHFLPGMENYRLETLSRSLGLSHERPHRAGSDARATAELFSRIVSTAGEGMAGYLRPRPLPARPKAQVVETRPGQIS